ncbi:TPA: hypothetical protein ACP495_001322 [Klebsiella pneumoniae]|uniref:hypothetical protein n=1 Tax=Klebsiella pneumoniae complex TaxID=3390273 RepID=UPI000A7C8EF2|nr:MULTISPECIES: hypothetical protein [Klebsiella]KAA8856641.1 hypothetical protein F3Y17_25460 [Klebsiella pneumoniae]MBE8849748.1 hypothetical protein [Klebsiella pneumoniae]MBX8857172.1 hypothetical protein [Klebsiella variicola]MBX8883691.1 hypothetical protein [Klebsiella variicola]MBY8368453.1 hypothetical protein [Klebsiella pneumoniae]
MSTNNLKEAVNHNTYNAPVTINNYYVSPVPPPEEPPVVPAKKKRGWVFETASILLGTVITLWQSMYNGVMMSVLTDGLIWLGVSSGAAPVCATGLIAFGVCAAPTLLLSFGRWVVNQK